jgi:hypothetical protein
LNAAAVKTTQSSQAKVIAKKRPAVASKGASVTSREDSVQRGQARLTDLCAEDKSKIGELVKKLATETKEREKSVSAYEVEKK